METSTAYAYVKSHKRPIAYAILSSAILAMLAHSANEYNSDESKRLRAIATESKNEAALYELLANHESELLAFKDGQSFSSSCVKANQSSYVDCYSDSFSYPKYSSIEYVPSGSGSKAPAFPTANASEQEPTAPPRLLQPSELLGPTKVSDKCHVTQTENEHVRQERGGMFATDIACNFGEGLGKRAEVYAPDLRDKPVNFRVEHVGHDELLGSFVQLVVTDAPSGSSGTESFYLGHTETRLKPGDTVTTGQRIGQMTMDGATTGWHVHFEYRRLGADGNTWKSERYFTGTRDQALDNKRKKKLPTGWKWGDKFYFTHYDLGDPNQNDSAPCHGASGKDLCEMERNGTKTIALTVDVRNALGIKFGDRIKLDGPCSGTYEVHDEMASRYRYANVMREGYPIKGDIPSCSGGIHSITKL